MKPNKVVVRFKDGTIMKGNTSDFFPNKASFHLSYPEGKIEEIDVKELKAVFFVKDFKTFVCHSDILKIQVDNYTL